MRKWGWYSDEGIYNPGNTDFIYFLVITYPHGKKDWVDFKTATLRQFQNELAAIDTVYGFKCKHGIQPAPLYTNVTEDRGYHDPTSLFESADFIITADGPNNYPDFNWSADIMRSIANFWKIEKTKSNVKFATELSWLYFNVTNNTHTSDVYYPFDTLDAVTIADRLNHYYPLQIKIFYDKGASAIFLSHFGNDPDINTARLVIENRAIEHIRYIDFIDTLKYFKNRGINSNITCDHANHISFEQGLYVRRPYGLDCYNHNEGVSINTNIYNGTTQYEYPLITFCQKLSNYTLDYAYNGTGDFITNFMIRYDPAYFTKKNYSYIYLTGTSNFIPDDVYEIFMQPSYSKKFIYTTRYSDTLYPGIFREYFTPGLYNEYNVKRTPIRFLWQTRTDLQGIFPNCSLPNPTQTQYGWYLNDLTKDIVFWANNNAIQQYRGFSIYNSSSNPHYYYDVNIAKCWHNSSTDSLQQKYPDGHYRANSSVQCLTMLEFAIAHDPSQKLAKSGVSPLTLPVPDYSMFNGYSSWPRITTVGSMSKEASTVNMPITFSLAQNFPNPFNPTTKINYSVPSKSYITLKIYDILGREISTLVNEVKQPGNYSVVFNASRLSSGVYIYTLSNQSSRISKKLLFIK